MTLLVLAACAGELIPQGPPGSGAASILERPDGVLVETALGENLDPSASFLCPRRPIANYALEQGAIDYAHAGQIQSVMRIEKANGIKTVTETIIAPSRFGKNSDRKRIDAAATVANCEANGVPTETNRSA